MRWYAAECKIMRLLGWAVHTQSFFSLVCFGSRAIENFIAGLALWIKEPPPVLNIGHRYVQWKLSVAMTWSVTGPIDTAN